MELNSTISISVYFFDNRLDVVIRHVKLKLLHDHLQLLSIKHIIQSLSPDHPRPHPAS